MSAGLEFEDMGNEMAKNRNVLLGVGGEGGTRWDGVPAALPVAILEQTKIRIRLANLLRSPWESICHDS